MEIKRVSLIGLGALGILFARPLSDYLAPGMFKIIADRERIDRYARGGVTCNGERCRFEYIEPDTDCPPDDLIIIAVKMNGLNDAIRAVRHHVGPNTTILSLLNGVSSEERIAQAYGMDKLLLCVAQGMDAVKVGTSLTYSHTGQLSIGDIKPGPVSGRLEAADRFLTAAGISHEVVPDMRKRLWSKFMINVGANQTTAVYRCNYRGIQKGGAYRDTMIAAMREAAALAVSENIDLSPADIDYWLGVIDSLNPDGKTSMQQDMDAGRPTEVELFAGTILKLAEKHGFPCPVNAMLYDEITSAERRHTP